MERIGCPETSVVLIYASGTAWPLNMGRIGCPETSETNYQYSLRNILEERRSHLHGDEAWSRV